MGRYFLHPTPLSLSQVGRELLIKFWPGMTFQSFSYLIAPEYEDIIAYIPCKPEPIAPYLEDESVFKTFFVEKWSILPTHVLQASHFYAVRKHF